MTTPGGAGTTHPLVLGSSASLIGSDLFQIRRYRAPALRCAPVLRRYNSRTSSGEEGKGLGFRCGAPALYRALPLAPMPQGVSYVQVSGLGLYIRTDNTFR